MLALYADGRQAEALEAYQDARRYLADELGLDPSPELQELERAILNPGGATTPERARCRRLRPRRTTHLPTSRSPRRACRAIASPDPPGRHSAPRRLSLGRPSTTPTPRCSRCLSGVPRRSFAGRSSDMAGIIDRADQAASTAVFGLAVAREDDALRAVRAAVELRGAARSNSTVAQSSSASGSRPGRSWLAPGDGHGPAGHRRAAPARGRLAERPRGAEVLLAIETERLVRGATSTEPVARGETTVP